MARSRANKSDTLELKAAEGESTVQDSAAEDVDGDESEAKVPAGSAASKSMSKARAARYAIEQGYESPQEAVAFILDELGIEMAPQHFSAVKSQMRKRERDTDEGSKPSAGPRRGRPPAISSMIANSTRKAGGVGDDELDLLDAMEAIKPLVENLGADRVKRIVDLLG